MTTTSKLRIIAPSLALAGLLCLPLLSGARPPHDGGPALLEQQIEQLDLDDATLAKVYQVIDTARAESRKLHKAKRDASKRMHELLDQDQPDEAAVMAQVDAVSVVQTAIRKHDLRTLLQVSGLVPADQRAKLREQMRRRHRGHHDGGRSHHGRGMRGDAPGAPDAPPAE